MCANYTTAVRSANSLSVRARAAIAGWLFAAAFRAAVYLPAKMGGSSQFSGWLLQGDHARWAAAFAKKKTLRDSTARMAHLGELPGGSEGHMTDTKLQDDILRRFREPQLTAALVTCVSQQPGLGITWAGVPTAWKQPFIPAP